MFRKLKGLAVSLLFASSFVLVGCNAPTFRLHKNYFEFINNYTIYEEVGGGDIDPPICEAIDVIDGFTPIYNYKVESIVSGFFGDYIEVNFGEKCKFLDKNGQFYDNNLHSTMIDITIIDRKFNKLIVKNNANAQFGVVDIFGNYIIDCLYSNITIENGVIICKDINGYYIYKDKTYKGFSVSKPIISNNELIVIDGKYYYIDSFDVAHLNGYEIVGNPIDNIVAVCNTTGKIGFCEYPNGNIIIQPTYAYAGQMSDGIACVYDYGDKIEYGYLDYPKLIDKNNGVIFDFENLVSLDLNFTPLDITVYNHKNGFVLFNINGNINGYIDIENSCKVTYIVDGFLYDFVCGDYLLIKPGAFYSLNDGKIIKEYSQIISFYDYFIVKNGEYFEILDSKLNILIDKCAEILPYENTIIVNKDGKYGIYKLNS